MSARNSSKFEVSGSCKVMRKLIETLQRLSPNTEITSEGILLSKQNFRKLGVESSADVKISWDEFMQLESRGNWWESQRQDVVLGAWDENLLLTPSLLDRLKKLQDLLKNLFLELDIPYAIGEKPTSALWHQALGALDLLRRVMSQPCLAVVTRRQIVWNSYGISSLAQAFSVPFTYIKGDRQYLALLDFEKARRSFYETLSRKLDSDVELENFLRDDYWLHSLDIARTNSRYHFDGSDLCKWDFHFGYSGWETEPRQLERALATFLSIISSITYYSPVLQQLHHWAWSFRNDCKCANKPSAEIALAGEGVRHAVSNICNSSCLMTFLLLDIVRVKVDRGIPVFFMPDRLFVDNLMTQLFSAPGLVSFQDHSSEENEYMATSETEVGAAHGGKNSILKRWGWAEANALWGRY